MAKMTFPYACARLKNYFSPIGFEAVLDSPTSMKARLFDVKTGETFALVSGLPWSVSITDSDLRGIIDALEDEMSAQEFVHQSLEGDSLVDG